MKKTPLDLPPAYLSSTFAQAMGLPAMVNGKMSHNQVTRLLAARK